MRTSSIPKRFSSHTSSRGFRRAKRGAESIIEELATDPEAPLEYVGWEQASIWLTDRAAAQAYVADLREDPPWFDP